MYIIEQILISYKFQQVYSLPFFKVYLTCVIKHDINKALEFLMLINKILKL